MLLLNWYVFVESDFKKHMYIQEIVHFLKCLQVSLNMIQLNDKKGYVLDTGNNIYVCKGSKISSNRVGNVINQLTNIIYSDNYLINGKSYTSTIENRYSFYSTVHKNNIKIYINLIQVKISQKYIIKKKNFFISYRR